MTVYELIQELTCCDADFEVFVRGNNEQEVEIKSVNGFHALKQLMIDIDEPLEENQDER